jgi:hypothetical protein
MQPSYQHANMSEFAYFAGQALNALLTDAERSLPRHESESVEAWMQRVADLAWKMAGTMVERRPG